MSNNLGDSSKATFSRERSHLIILVKLDIAKELKMFGKKSIKHSSQNLTNNSSLSKIVVELDEYNEESLSGGSSVKPPNNALVLLFPNPFSA
ncbi:MAG: hypothetical protein KME31_24425 [Tolypothrix carrinoi HA7290-LM1]|jgi:hypothetical protein|nr:hypothetical protein [Tolypothrix carrinoi HA7290-LM1]